MFTHDQIWAAIDRLADTRGLSASGLARQAGLDPTAFNKSKRISPNGKPRWPSTESLSKILAVTSCTMSDLLALMDENAEAPKAIRMLSYTHVKLGRINEKPSSSLAFGPVTGEDSFAVTLGDDRLSPLFGEGSILIVDPSAKLKADDRALIYTRKGGLQGGIVQSVQKKTLNILLSGDNFSATDFAENDIEWTARILWARH